MKAVFDTNVLVAAFLTEGICSTILVRARGREFELILCTDIVKEFGRVLQKKFSATPSEMADVLAILSEAAHEIRPQVKPIASVCRDPDDDLILACAAEVKADYIVTGDEDLLTLKRYQGIKIISPRDFESLFPA